MWKRIPSLALGPLAGVWDQIPSTWRRQVLFATNDHFLIGVVGLLTDAKRRVLLLQHRFRTPWRWGLPGGFVTRGESLQDALIRELLEEVGVAIAVDPNPIDWDMNPQRGVMSITLTGRTLHAPEPLEVRSPEIVGGGFYRRDELPDGLHPYHRALILQYLSGD